MSTGSNMSEPIDQQALRNRFNPDGSLLRAYQLRMFEMLRFIDEVCRRHHIRYWLCSGTLLGAVRHGGFIPWDDDLDIEMLREDYERFVKVMEVEKNGRYDLQTHRTDPDYFAPYGKVRDLRSTIKEDNTNDWYYKYHGAYIDVFIMDPSSSEFLCKLAGFMQDKLLYGANRTLKKWWGRKLYFSVAYPLLYKVLFPLFRCLGKMGAHGQLRHTPGSCFLSPREEKDIFPLGELMFEGGIFPVPGNYDAYLTKIYGCYMSLPDLDKIVMHTVNVELNE